MPGVHASLDSLVVACWGVFAVVWVGGALYNVRRAPHARRRSLGSSAWFVVALLLWVIARRIPGVDSLRIEALSLHAEPDAVCVLGAALLVVSTGFTLWARVVLGTMWSSSPVAKSGHVLHTEGPYSITRHPIYTGILGMVLGSAIALDFGVWIYVLVAVALFLELRIRSEERLMRETFPGAYDEYRRRVPQLIPGLRRLSSSGS
jgi:protein-S-isoprenylcysteine O-methyltransferase Ste14